MPVSPRSSGWSSAGSSARSASASSPCSGSGPWPSGSAAASARVRASGASRAERESAEALRVRNARGASRFLGAIAQELPEPLPGLFELAGVAEERIDLSLEVVADVDPAVRFERAGQIDALDLVNAQPLAEMLGEVVRVARGGR